jgi:uncharacterized protein
MTLVRMPIFPLHTVLFPDGRLPLKIFEQRYLEMTKTCLRDSMPFGVCRIRAGAEVGAPAQHESVGCSAIIRHWEMPHMGVFHLVTQGVEVFRVVRAALGPLGLIEAEIEPLAETSGTLQPVSVELCRRVLQTIVERFGSEAVRPPHLFDTPRWVSYRLAELLPLPQEEKQLLLEERDDARRIDRLYQLLNDAR